MCSNYKCLSCGYEFDTPEVYYERHGFTDGLYERWSVCPNCGEADYTDEWDDDEEEDE